MERREAYREQIMTNVDYDYLVGYTAVDRERLDELVGLMLDTVCSTKPTIRVAGEELPTEVVRSRLLKLTGAHLRYVLERINENTTEVRHVKPYLLTALYNAPLTMDNHYGVITDSSLTMGNSAYRFPASVAADASQEVLEAKARDMVDYTFWQLMMQAGVDTLADADLRCNVCIVEDGASLLIYVLYAG